MTLSGADAEQRSARHLEQNGLQLVCRNYRCRFGEIDLIAEDGAELVFVEVRLRSRASFGGALESIDARKQAKLIAAAQHYLASLSYVPPCRFDVIMLDGAENLVWMKNAFSA